jgi:hypothetical protein
MKPLVPLLLGSLLLTLHNVHAQTSAPPVPAPPAQGQPVQIDRNGVLILIRSNLLALDHANRTGNYTVLRDLGAPGFQTGNTAARLSEIFANLRSQNLDLSGIAILDPQLTVLPTAVQGGLMRMAGFFPSVPTQVNFDLLFAPVENRWRLFGISLNLGQAAPVAPAPQPPAEKPPEQATAPKADSAPRPNPQPKRSSAKSPRRESLQQPVARPAPGDAPE